MSTRTKEREARIQEVQHSRYMPEYVAVREAWIAGWMAARPDDYVVMRGIGTIPDDIWERATDYAVSRYDRLGSLTTK